VEGRVEVGTKKQAKGLLRHCMPILENTEEGGEVAHPTLSSLISSQKISMHFTYCC